MADKRIILIADDEPDSLEFLRFLAEQRGYEVVTAVTGKEAIDKVINLQPDLVVLDIMMPVLGGHAVCEQLKNNDLLKRIKVILITAKDRAMGEDLAKKVRADAFLPKPVETEKLFSYITELLEKQDKESPRLTKKLGL